MSLSEPIRHPWRYRSYLATRSRFLLRPVCWLTRHEPRLILTAAWVSEHARKPPSSVCDRCGKFGV